MVAEAAVESWLFGNAYVTPMLPVVESALLRGAISEWQLSSPISWNIFLASVIPQYPAFSLMSLPRTSTQCFVFPLTGPSELDPSGTWLKFLSLLMFYLCSTYLYVCSPHAPLPMLLGRHCSLRQFQKSGENSHNLSYRLPFVPLSLCLFCYGSEPFSLLPVPPYGYWRRVYPCPLVFSRTWIHQFGSLLPESLFLSFLLNSIRPFLTLFRRRHSN